MLDNVKKKKDEIYREIGLKISTEGENLYLRILLL